MELTIGDRDLTEKACRKIFDGRCRRRFILHPELVNRFFDLEYCDLVSDPVAAVRQVYRQFEIPLKELTMHRVRQLASKRSRYPTGRNLSLAGAELSARPA